MAPTAIINDGNAVLVPDLAPNGIQKSTKKSSILHRNLHSEPLRVVRASGMTLELENGEKLLDTTGGAAVACLGHGNQRVNQAVAKQMQDFSYSHTMTFSSLVAEELGDLLTASTHGHMSKAFIVSSGSEAMEAAMKLARQFYLESVPAQPRRVNFIARNQSYHGNTLGALSMSGHVARRALFEPILMPHISRVSACNSYRGKLEAETDAGYVSRLMKELDDEFQRLGPDTVCAFVAEPMVGAALGCVPAVKGYFSGAKAICDKYGALLILDEVMCGMGRSGTLHAWEQEDVIPDIQTIGKGLGGGYAAIAGILINSRVVDVLNKGTGAFSHGQTYQGHPVACAAALEVQRIIQEDHLVDNVRAMGKLLSLLLKEKLDQHPNVGDIRGNGLFWGIEFVSNKLTKEPFSAEEAVANRVHDLGLKPPYSLSLYPGNGTADGTLGDHVLLAPPYNVTEAEIERIADLTAAVIKDYFGPR